MKKLLLSLLFAVLPLSAFAASGTAIPGGSQSTPFVINKPGAYYLAANRVMTATGLNAIQIEAPDVTLDLNGFTLSFTNINGTGYGIMITSENVEIRNGSITTVPYGAIRSVGGAATRVIDVRVSDSAGIQLVSSASLVERCHIIDSRGQAVLLGGHGCTLKDSHIYYVEPFAGSSTSHGVYASTACKVVGNHFESTRGSAIYCPGSGALIADNHVYEANLGKSSSAAGILASGSHVRVRGNSVYGCLGAGITLTENSYGCVVENNVVGRTEAASPLVGSAIVSQVPSTILRGNMGMGNAGGLIAGNFIDGGNNVGN